MSPPPKMTHEDVLASSMPIRRREVVVRVMFQRPAPEDVRLRSLMWMVVDTVSTLLFIAAVFERRATFHRYARNAVFVYCVLKCIACIVNGVIAMRNIKRPQTSEVVFEDMEYVYMFRFAVHCIVTFVLFW